MGDDKKPGTPMSNPFAWVFRASMLLLGAVIALNLAITWLCAILPWLISGVAVLAVGWIVVAIVRWRRAKY